MKIKSAIIDVANTDRIIDFAKSLQEEFGIKIFSKGETADLLRDSGVKVITYDNWYDSNRLIGPSDLRDVGVGLGRAGMIIANIAKANWETPLDLIKSYDSERIVLINAAKRYADSIAIVTEPGLYRFIIAQMTELGGHLSPETHLDFLKRAMFLTGSCDMGRFNFLNNPENMD